MERMPWAEALARPALVVVLVRHGRTSWNATHRFLGRTDIPLDEVGHEEARVLGRAMSGTFGQVYSSPLSRAWQTANYLHTEPSPIPELQELHQGHLEGLHAQEAISRYPDFFQQWRVDPTQYPVPGGEGFDDCQTRAVDALKGIAARHAAGEVVAAVTHQMVIASVLCHILEVPLVRWREYRVGNTAMAVLAYDEGQWEVCAPRWQPG